MSDKSTQEKPVISEAVRLQLMKVAIKFAANADDFIQKYEQIYLVADRERRAGNFGGEDPIWTGWQMDTPDPEKTPVQSEAVRLQIMEVALLLATSLEEFDYIYHQTLLKVMMRDSKVYQAGQKPLWTVRYIAPG